MQDRFPPRRPSTSPRVILSAAAIMAGALTTQHAAAQALPPAVAACMSESNATQRLACYDREVPHAAASTRATAPTPGAATSAATPKPTSPTGTAAGAASTAQAPSDANAFGLTPQLQRKQPDAPPPPPAKLTAHITAVSQRLRGESVVTLDNGQVWEEAEITSHLPLRIGDGITIKRGMLGAFYMSTKQVLGLRVKRVQ